MSLQSTFPSEIPEQTREIGEAILAKSDVCYYLGHPFIVSRVTVLQEIAGSSGESTNSKPDRNER